MKRFRRVLGAVAATSLLLIPVLVINATPASAEPCDLTISSSYTLTDNITGCAGVGIHITGSNLTLDLNGKTISCRPGLFGDGPGISVMNQRNVTIRNGTVTQCDSGIYIEEGGGNLVTNVVLRDNIGHPRGLGIFGEGLQMYGSNDNRIIGNQVIHNGTFAGIVGYDSNRNTVSNNLVADNNIVQVNAAGQPRVMQDIGIWFIFIGDFVSTAQNVITGNQVFRNGLDGIQVGTASVENAVMGNNVVGNGFGQLPGTRNGFGIAVSGQRQHVQNNQVFNNGGNGINVAFNSRNHRIFYNNAGGNGRVPLSSGAAQFDLNDLNTSPPCDNNQWVGNTGTRNQPCIG